MVPTDVTTSDRASLLGSQARGFIAGLWIGPALAICMVVRAPRSDEGSAICLAGRLNPNTATASSLARLPGVGLARASAIVAYRSGTYAETGREANFERPADLQKIKGIGPKTVQQIAPWLDFHPSAHSTAGAIPPPAWVRPPEP